MKQRVDSHTERYPLPNMLKRKTLNGCHFCVDFDRTLNGGHYEVQWHAGLQPLGPYEPVIVLQHTGNG